LITLLSDTAYHSFIGEVEALNTTTIRRLTLSCRHQHPAIAQSLSRHSFPPHIKFRLGERFESDHVANLSRPSECGDMVEDHSGPSQFKVAVSINDIARYQKGDTAHP
jgi:hypothetical protein